ncbi:target of rapamycin complex subunit lst8 [Cimex lectularius]|uniref:Target of rapamycin complex subunit lst8 n=1 Tax=Cimex lectularius TaxID=79782 RepID=A0A8I6S1T7_CIMLE|nr:target of rapamycin complex subunit lst8 [Cimex lectularius]
MANFDFLATGGYDHTIRYWYLTGVCVHTVQHTDSQVNALAITPDKQRLAAAGHQHIKLYDIESGHTNPIINYEGISKNVTGVGFQEDGNWMFTGGEDGTARVWDIRSKNLQCQRIFQMTSPVNCVCLHPNQGEMFVGDQSGVIHIWDLKTDHNEQLIPEAEASIQSISIDPEAKLLTAVNNKGNCYIWSLTNENDEQTKLKPRQKIAAHSRYALRCTLSPDSKLLVTCSADQTARVWETDTFGMVQVLKHDSQRWVWDAVFSADSKYLITASSDGVARLWNLETGAVEREFSGHQKPVTALAYSENPKIEPVA